jgi:thiamine-monophosphate kinase
MPVDEFSLIYRYFSSLGRGEAVDLSVGDDCAILRLQAGERLATSVDTMVAGVHFFPDTFPEDIAFRAVSAAASDLAAMGARPLGMTIAITLPDTDELWLNAFSQGLAAAIGQFQLPLVGGDTTRGPLAVCVQVMGALPMDKALLRGGACPGELVYVSGTLGDAAGALAFLQGEWQPVPVHAEYLLDRFYRPTARLELGRELLGHASAAIDISDGLLADLGHVCRLSGVGAHLAMPDIRLGTPLAKYLPAEEALALAVTGGDDYELLLTVDPAREQALVALGDMLDVPLHRIGVITAGEGVMCMDSNGKPVTFAVTGYRHF